MGLKPEPPRTGRDYIGAVRGCYRRRIRYGTWAVRKQSLLTLRVGVVP